MAGLRILPLQNEICTICPVGLHIIPIHFQNGNTCLSGNPKNQKRLWRYAGENAGTHEATAKPV